MIKDFTPIKGAGFPTDVEIKSASGAFPDMGARTINVKCRFDGQTTPDFSKAWEFVYKDNKYIMPLRKPQGSKENETLSADLELIFQHWAEYQLQQKYFFEIHSVEAGNIIPDKYIASVELNLENFFKLYSRLLEYWYGDTITLDIDEDTIKNSTLDAQKVEINYSYMWDVLLESCKIYGVRCKIVPNGDHDHYVIKIRYGSQTELSHLFEYGYKGGLLKVERQVQNPDIRNVVYGRGGGKNLPYRYFKAVDPNNPSYKADPDWIPELALMPFTQLFGATFRSYIRGWKAKHYGGTTTEAECYAPWAWKKGYTDEKFAPVEFVYDAESIAFYGELMTALEDNEDVFPSIQHRIRADIGRIDEVVAVEPIISDDYIAKAEKESKKYNANQCTPQSILVKKDSTGIATLVNGTFDVDEGMTAEFDPGVVSVETYDNPRFGAAAVSARGRTPQYDKSITDRNIRNIYINGKPYSPPLTSGRYTWSAEVEVRNNADKDLTVTVALNNPTVKSADIEEDFSNTWCVWIKDVFNTPKPANKSEEAFASEVWDALLGDHLGNEAALFFTSGVLSTSEDYKFLLAKRPEYDTSKTIEVSGVGQVRSMWKLTLQKSDAELEATNLWLPSTKRQASAGDHFAFEGIELPHQYTLYAEEEIDNVKKQELDKIKDIKPTWVVSLDKVRISKAQFDDATALIDQLVPGATVRLHDPRFILNADGTPAAYETLYITNINIEWREPADNDPALIPDVEITLSDKYEEAVSTVSRMQSDIDALTRQVASLGNIEQLVRAVCDKLYLRKDGISDISMSPTQFFSLLTSGDFRSGMIGGAGWGMFRDANGNWVFETDRINVRQELAVNSLVINQVKGQGGTIVESAAVIEEVTDVVTDASGIYCYFDTKNGTVFNQFRVDDVAYSSRYVPSTAADNTNEAYSIFKFYKRRVIEVGENYIKLSVNPAEINGNGLPYEGDSIIQYGNYTDKNRQYVKVRDVIGGGYERYLEGLDSVNATGTEYYFVGRQAGMYNGRSRWFIGDSKGYIEWVNGELNIKGRINSLSTIDDKTIGNYVNSAAQSAANAAKAELLDKIDDLQNQVDGVIESFNGQGAPTLNNYPANEWTTDEERKRHDRDIYTDITPYVDEETTPTSGQSWKWYYNSPTDYGWTKIADSEAVRALQLAQMSVLDTDVFFKQGTSRTEPPVPLPTTNDKGDIINLNGWSTNAPTWQEGKYIWQTTYVKKGDGGAYFSSMTCISGKDGNSVTISSQSVKYSTNHGANQPMDSTFTLDTVPTLTAGEYLWSRTEVVYSNGQSTKSYAVSRIGDNGAAGASYSPNLLKGANVKKNSNSYELGRYTWDNRPPEGTQCTLTICAKVGEKDELIGIYQDNGYNSFGTFKSKTETVQSYIFSIRNSANANPSVFTFFHSPNDNDFDPDTYVKWAVVTTGNDPAKEWVPAASEMVAPTITATSVTYAKSTKSTQPADSEFIYKNISEANPTAGDYLWTKTSVTYSDGSETKSYSVARLGADGTDGTPGAAGVDGNTSYVHFAYASGITGNLPHPTNVIDFSTTAFDGAKYIGICTDYNQADPATDVGQTYEWSEYKGNGIDRIEEEYYLSTSRTELIGGSWSTKRQTWVAGHFYWTRSHVYYTDGTDETYGEVCVTGESGANAPNLTIQYSTDTKEWHTIFAEGDIWMRTSNDGGSTWSAAAKFVGEDGADGQYRKFQWSKNTSTTTAPTSGWSDTPMTAAVGEYIWMRSGIVVPPATDPAKWDAATRLTGDKGQDGDSVYMLDLSDEIMPMPCDAAGNVVGAYKTSQATVYKGGTAVTSDVSYSIAQQTGVSATISDSGLVTPSNLTADKGTIVVQAVVSGVTLQTTLSLYKVKPGVNGASYSPNLLKGANKELTTVNSFIGRYYYDVAPIVGKTYTLTLCYKCGEKADYITACHFGNGTWDGNKFYSKTKTIESRVFTIIDSGIEMTNMAFYNYLNGSLVADADSVIYWALLQEGDTGEQTQFVPAASEMVGEEGQPAVVYSLELSDNNVSRNAIGQLSTTAIAVRKYKTTGNSPMELTTEKKIRYQRIGVDNGYTEVLSGVSSTLISVPNDPSLTAIVVELMDDNNFVLDRERIPLIQDGTEMTENLVKNSELNTTMGRVITLELTEPIISSPDISYTFTIWCSKLGNATGFELRDPNAYMPYNPPLYFSKIGDGIYSLIIDHLPNEYAYQLSKIAIATNPYDSMATFPTINRVKVEKGVNHAPVWTQSPHDMDYLKMALREQGSMEGGLILASLMQMGYTKSGKYQVMSGVNGIAEPQDALAFWAGGVMIDPDKQPSDNPPKFGVRHDGTAFAAGNTIKFKENLIKVGDYINLDKDGLRLNINGYDRLVVGNEKIDGLAQLTVRAQRIILEQNGAIYNGSYDQYALRYIYRSTGYNCYLTNIANINKTYTLGSVNANQSISFNAPLNLNVGFGFSGSLNKVDIDAVPKILVKYYDGSSLLTEVEVKARPTVTAANATYLTYDLPSYTSTSNIYNLQIKIEAVNSKISNDMYTGGMQMYLKTSTGSFEAILTTLTTALKDVAVLGYNGTQFSWGDTHQYQQNGLWGVRVANYGIMITSGGISIMTDGEKYTPLNDYIKGVVNGTIQ